MPFLPSVEAADTDAMADALAHALDAHGACRLPAFPDAAATLALREDLRRLQACAALTPAAVGRGAAHGLRSDIRGDATLWLDDARAGAVAATYLAALDALRIALNRRLFLGLDEVEAHYAAYPAGARYASVGCCGSTSQRRSALPRPMRFISSRWRQVDAISMLPPKLPRPIGCTL
jgi:SM-20-related protein